MTSELVYEVKRGRSRRLPLLRVLIRRPRPVWQSDETRMVTIGKLEKFDDTKEWVLKLNGQDYLTAEELGEVTAVLNELIADPTI